MVAPLTYYQKTEINTTRIKKTKSGFRQAQPYNVDTSYFSSMVVANEYMDARSVSWGLSTGSWPFNLENASIRATNTARARFVGRLGDSSSFGATIAAEGKSTYDLVVGTILRLGRAARAIKRFDLATGARELGLPYIERTVSIRRSVKTAKGTRRLKRVRYRVFRLPNGREVQKTAANGWLMFSYGAQPLMADVYNGMDLLTRPTPSNRFSAGASSSQSYTERYGGPGTGLLLGVNTWSTQVSVRVAADVTVSNPNLWLANKMGLINPVQWINEAIPFSFVLDWCSNLSQIIGQMTDFAGLTISKPCTTILELNKESHFHGDDPPWSGPYTGTAEQRKFWRNLTIPSARLHFEYERFGWQRGLNAISLLVQFLPHRKN